MPISMFRLVLFFLIFTQVAYASTKEWIQFNGPNHIFVLYPPDWFKLEGLKDRLTIRSSEGGAEGVGIKNNQAEISVMVVKSAETKSLQETIDYFTQGAPVLSRKEVHNDGVDSHGCENLTEIVFKEEAVAAEDVPIHAPRIVYDDFFCEKDGQKYAVLERNWEGDRQQSRYHQIALRMAKSLRVSQ